MALSVPTIAPQTRLREWREYNDLTLEEASERLDLSVSYLSRLERGVRRPSGRALYRLSKRTGLSPYTLLEAPEEDGR